MSRPQRVVVLFVAALLVAAALAWLAGYNFDYRSPAVAAHAGLALVFAFLFAGLAELAWEDLSP